MKSKQQKIGFIAIALIMAIATVGLSQQQSAQAQTTGEEFCYTETIDGGQGITCFPTKEECKDFRNAIKHDVDSTTPCKAQPIAAIV